jgi:UPF0716 protein FxsA
MRFLIALILLAFPFAEIFLLVKLGHQYGWWVLFYLVVIGFLGLQLIRGEKLLLSAKMMQSLSAGGNPIKTLLGSARNMVAGVLLIIPGVMTDIIAVILLLIPISKQKLSSATNQQQTQQARHEKAANDDVIEGEYTEIKEDLDKAQDKK